MKKIITILLLLNTFLVFAQAPANDNCENAVDLGKAPSCTNTVYSNKNATKTDIGSNNNPFCSNDGNVDSDVWFSFVASDTIFDYTISVKSFGATGIKQPNVNFYRGSCGKDNLLKVCNNSPTTTAIENSFNIYGLAPGETYYIRVSDLSAEGDFKICVTEIKSITIDQGGSTACSGFLYDSGGSGGNYKANEKFTFKICPSDPHQCIKLDFTYFNIDLAGDNIKIYDGADDKAPLIANITGASSKGANAGAVAYSVAAGSGCMTVVFTSDGDVTFEGFEAQWQCSSDACVKQVPITVNNKATPQEIIKNVSSNGTLVKLDTIICDKRAYGTFLAGVNTDLGLGKGLILSTGKASDAGRPNNGNASTSLGTVGDSDLDKLSAQKSNDACVVEFDVFASTDEVNFEYIFGSEEYPEFVNSFNDIFAFVISGPGIVGDPALGNKKNMAIIPGTNNAVEINSVNTNLNWQYYRDNTNGPSTIYDGLTSDKFGIKKSLTARASVTPCKTYRLKMAIADRGDSAYDSGVFVSEIKGATPEITYSSPNKIDYLAEKCSGINDKIKFSIYKALPTDASFVVKIKGTAIKDVDYTFNIPNVITFPAGTTELSFPILAIADNVKEGNETIEITLSRDFGCGSIDLVTKTVKLVDQLDIKIMASLDTITLCKGGDGKQIFVEGATFYTWSPASLFNNSKLQDPVVKTAQSQFIYVTGQVGNCIGKDTAWVNVFEPEIAIKPLTNVSVCEGQIVKLEAVNNTKNSNIEWGPDFLNFSDPNAPITSLKASFSINIFATTEAGGCIVGDTIALKVNPVNMPFLFPDTTVCQGLDVQLASTSFGNSTFLWSPTTGIKDPTKTNAIIKADKTTQYILTGTSADGTCSAKDTINVKVKINNVNITGPDTIKVCKPDTISLTAIASGAINATNFKWSGKNLLIKSKNALTTKVFPYKSGWVYVQYEGSGCLAKDSVWIQKDSLPTDLALASIKAMQPYCEGDTVLIYSNSILKPQYPKAVVEWTSKDAQKTISPTTNVNLLVLALKSGFYYRTITNGACVRKDTFKMTVLPVVKPVGLKDTSVCAGEKVQVNIKNAKDYDSFAWEGPGLSCKDCPNPILSGAGLYSVKVTIKGFCPVTASMLVLDKNKPLNVTPNNTQVCEGKPVNVSLTLTTLGATNLVWTPASGLSCTDCANPVVTKLGTYTLSGIVNTCKSTTSVTISQIDTSMTIVANGKICQSDKVTLDLANSSQFTNLKWIPSTNLSCPDCPNPTTTLPGTYFLKATKDKFCPSTGKVVVELSNNPKPIAFVIPKFDICEGQPINVKAQVQTAGLTNIVWTPSIPNCPTCTEPLVSNYGTYTITGKLGACEAKGDFSVNKLDTSMVLSVSGKICGNATAKVTLKDATEFSNFSWSEGLKSEAQPEISKVGTYVLKATKKNGCKSSGKITTESGTFSKINLTASPSILLTNVSKSITLNVTADNNFNVSSLNWNVSGLDANGLSATDENVVNIDSVKTYIVNGLSNDGCPVTDTLKVYKFKYPLVILPESNDINSSFRFIKFPFQIAKIQEFGIVNRWGEIVYKVANIDARDPNYAWKGLSDQGVQGAANNSFVPSDAYTFYLKATVKGEEKAVLVTGDFTVLR